MRKDIPANELHDRIISKFQGKTAKEVADILGIHESLIGKWKRHGIRPSHDVLDKVAEIMGLPHLRR